MGEAAELISPVFPVSLAFIFLPPAMAAGKAVEGIDISEYQPRRIPSAKCRERIRNVWEVAPLLCPRCQKALRIVALIDERILRRLCLWQQGVRVASSPDLPVN